MATALIVLAKRPVPGRVKTRLCPPLSEDDAATVAGAALRDTLEVVDATPAGHRLLCFDGDPEGWLPPGWSHLAQDRGGLDRRLAAAFRAHRGPALLVGMDTPQLTPADLTAFDPHRFDACLGPAADGGYWALGFHDPRRAADAILGVPMSTSETGTEQLRRLRELGLRVQVLDELVDVDTIDDAYTVAATAPHTRFADALRSVVPVGV